MLIPETALRTGRRPREDLYIDAYPESWYAVAPARSLKREQIAPFDAFGKGWVMYRTASGRVHVTSRFCPHMGASFHTGRVRGERVVCPFHHWEFEAGACKRIPYLEGGKIPTGACVETLPVREHLGWIWVFNGAAPAFELPDLPEARSPAYGVRHMSQWFNIHPLLILENGCDAQHFKTVHKVDFTRYHVEMVREDAHELAFRVHQSLRGPLGRSIEIVTGIHYVGGSVIFGSLEANGEQTARFIAAPLPVSFRRTHFHLIVFPRRLPRWLRAVDPLFQRWFARRLFVGATDDYLPIWSQMNTDHRGALVSEDRLQQRFRRFYRAHLPGPAAAAIGEAAPEIGAAAGDAE